MSRYIDADALDRAFSKLRFNNDGELEHYGDRPNWYLWGSEVENLIADAPSIDIVRCKECRYYHRLYGCQKHDDIDLVTSDDDYCSYGERKSDEPMTDAEITEFAKEIVHKMIDNSVIAEDAYPDLRRRMHEAVERLDEYYPSEDERSE